MYQLAVTYTVAGLREVASTQFIPSLPLAYPKPDPDLLVQLSTPVIAMVAQSIPIDCVFRAGRLLQYYSVEWFRGTDTNNLAGSRYSLQALSLTIQNVTAEDASQGYYCRVTVLDPLENRTVTATGYSTELKVISKYLYVQYMYYVCVYAGMYFQVTLYVLIHVHGVYTGNMKPIIMPHVGLRSQYYQVAYQQVEHELTITGVQLARGEDVESLSLTFTTEQAYHEWHAT